MPKNYTRLTTPLVRDGDRATGTLRPATWDEAFERTVAGLRAAGKAHGSQRFVEELPPTPGGGDDGKGLRLPGW